MNWLEIAATKIFLLTGTGWASVAASLLKSVLWQDDGGDEPPPDDDSDGVHSFLRLLIALLKIILEVPIKGLPSPPEIIIRLFGENIGQRIADFMSAVFDYPTIVVLLWPILLFGVIALIIGMSVGITGYIGAYYTQSRTLEKHRRIWKGESRLLQPVEYLLVRVLPVMGLAGLFLVLLFSPLILKSIVRKLYFVGFVYDLDNITVAKTIEDFLTKVAESGWFGMFAFGIIAAMLIVLSGWFLYVYLRRLISLAIETNRLMWNLGVWLLGDRLVYFSDLFAAWIRDVFIIIVMVNLVMITPYLVWLCINIYPSDVGTILGVILLGVMIEFATRFPTKVYEGWMQERAAQLMERLDRVGKWIWEEKSSTPTEEVSPETGGAPQGLRLGRFVGGVAKTAGNAAYDKARQESGAEEFLESAGAALGGGLAASFATKLGEGAVDWVKSRPWDRDWQMAERVAKSDTLRPIAEKLTEDHDFAIFYEALRLQDVYTGESWTQLTRRAEEKLTTMSEKKVAEWTAKGQRVTHLVKEGFVGHEDQEGAE